MKEENSNGSKKELSYILKLRLALQPQYQHMPLFQNGSAIIVCNKKQEILLEKRADRDQWCVPGRASRIRRNL